MNKLKPGTFLIETLIAIIILMIAAGVTLPLFQQDPLQELINEQELFAYTLHMLRQLAVSTGDEYEIFIDDSGTYYRYQTTRGEVNYILPTTVIFGIPPDINPLRSTLPKGAWCTFPRIHNGFCIKVFSNGKISPGFISMRNKFNNLVAALTYDASGLSYTKQYIYAHEKWESRN